MNLKSQRLAGVLVTFALVTICPARAGINSFAKTEHVGINNKAEADLVAEINTILEQNAFVDPYCKREVYQLTVSSEKQLMLSTAREKSSTTCPSSDVQSTYAEDLGDLDNSNGFIGEGKFVTRIVCKNGASCVTRSLSWPNGKDRTVNQSSLLFKIKSDTRSARALEEALKKLLAELKK